MVYGVVGPVIFYMALSNHLQLRWHKDRHRRTYRRSNKPCRLKPRCMYPDEVAVTGFRGICELEFLPLEGTYRVLECNPRPWLQIGLARQAGLNLPLMLYADVENKQALDQAAEVRPGVYWMSPEYDLLRSFTVGQGENLWSNLARWYRDFKKSEEIGMWNGQEPRLILERLLSYPAKLWKNRFMFRPR